MWETYHAVLMFMLCWAVVMTTSKQTKLQPPFIVVNAFLSFEGTLPQWMVAGGSQNSVLRMFRLFHHIIQFSILNNLII